MGAAAAAAAARGPRVGGGGPGVCRGAARDRRAGGPGRAEPPVTAPVLPAGPARFQCPEDFCARRLAPGAAFCPESLGAPGKRLLLISAPADFRPESLSGHRLALPGSPLLRASQPDGSQKVYRLQASREESAARLLIAAGRPERLACARPFGASLRIQERHAEPGAARALFPVAERPPPRLPQGLKQRFFPFGARLKGPRPSSEAAGKAARKRGKKRPLLPLKQALWRPEGPEQLLGGSPEPAGGLLGGWARAGSKPPLLEEEEAAATEPAVLPVLGGQLLWQDARPSGHLEEGSSSGEVEEPDRRRARKREKWKTGLETEELPDPSSRYWPPEQEPWWQGGREPEGDGGDCAGELAGCKAKKKKKKKTMQEELWDAAAIKEEPVDVPCQRSLPEENPRAIGEDPAGVPSCKKKKKKKSRERLAEGLWGAAAIKEELGDVPCPGNLLEEGLGSPREEPGWELAGYIKESPGKGAGRLWGIVALKEELGDAPSLGSLAQESRGVTPEDPAGELPNCKKKKKKSRERLVEGLWGVAAIKEEPRDISCLGSLLEEGLGSDKGGPAGELLACKKKKKGKLDKEPLQEQGTETQVDWATPLWQERGPEEPLQTNGAAPSPRPKKKKKGRREREDQAGLYAAGT
ncbi:DNA-directed RNA polymerase I subunit RPA34 [Pantherophis guttatus]|uniref:DNA-directed RNA polymerase I subunit RPA34 n=1 Tax=Pantherophis guttatus TaxID=94885 RepID=A0A6P9DRR3_PANGU|nr:DNA-directed RNA polymerase I subunit RPA34 [Pantherophis guttatus]